MNLLNALKWLDLGPGVRLQVMPLTTPVMMAARKDAQAQIALPEEADRELADLDTDSIGLAMTYAQFLGALRVEEVTFWLSHPQEHTRLGDGTVISLSLGASLWTGTIRLAQANHPRHAQMEALIAEVQTRVSDTARARIEALEDMFNSPRIFCKP